MAPMPQLGLPGPGIGRPPPKILLYSHDTFGLGNIRRTLLLAECLSQAGLLSAACLVDAGFLVGAFLVDGIHAEARQGERGEARRRQEGRGGRLRLGRLRLPLTRALPKERP